MRRTLEERFWAKVERGGPDDCWLWVGARNENGYGRIRYGDGSPKLAHRISLLLDGRDPGPLAALHSCDTPACVNPRHLSAGTQRENLEQMYRRGRGNDGERASNRRLTAEQVREIRRLYPSVGSVELAARFGIGSRHVRRLVSGDRWGRLAA